MAAGNARARMLADQRGLTTVEYVIALLLVAVAALGSWNAFGEDVLRHLRRADTSIRDEMTVGKGER